LPYRVQCYDVSVASYSMLLCLCGFVFNASSVWFRVQFVFILVDWVMILDGFQMTFFSALQIYFLK